MQCRFTIFEDGHVCLCIWKPLIVILWMHRVQSLIIWAQQGQPNVWIIENGQRCIVSEEMFMPQVVLLADTFPCDLVTMYIYHCHSAAKSKQNYEQCMPRTWIAIDCILLAMQLHMSLWLPLSTTSLATPSLLEFGGSFVAIWRCHLNSEWQKFLQQRLRKTVLLFNWHAIKQMLSVEYIHDKHAKQSQYL